jgi:hypothetical protein
MMDNATQPQLRRQPPTTVSKATIRSQSGEHGVGDWYIERRHVSEGGVALHIQKVPIYRVEDADDAFDNAVRELRERACTACRDCAKSPEVERWDCCVVFFSDKESAIHFCELWYEDA